MRVDVYEVANMDLVNAMLYAPKTQAEISFLQNSNNQASWNMLTEAGQTFANQTAYIQQQYAQANLQYQAAIYQQQIGNMYYQNFITPVATLEQFQQANLMTQRVVMAHPQMRELYMRQGIDGYADTYQMIDPHPGITEGYDYQRIHQGVVRSDPSGAEFVEFFFYDEDPNDVPLTAIDQHNASIILDNLTDFLEAGIDVSNVFGGKIQR